MAAVTEHSAETKKLKNKAKASLALLLIAVISISTATYAWFSLSNSTSVQSMIIEVGTGTTLKAYAGVNTSDDIDNDYFAVIKSEPAAGTTVTGEYINHALPKKVDVPALAADMKSLTEVKLWPVTSGNGATLYTEGLNAETSSTGSGPEKKYYVQLTLTFISDTTMDVYLNGSDSATDAEDGTRVIPAIVKDGAKPGGGKYTQADVDSCNFAIKALRISFDSKDEANNPVRVIYEPDNKDKNGTAQSTALAGLALKDLRTMTGVPTATNQVTFTHLGDNTGIRKDAADASVPLFSLVANEPKVVTIRMWVEGQDAQCINDTNVGVNIEKALLNVRFRFCGADPTTGDFIETAPR